MSDYTRTTTIYDALVNFGGGDNAAWIKLSAIESVTPSGTRGCRIYLASGAQLHIEDMTPGQIMDRITEAMKKPLS